jgi:hypothetical protein
MGETARAAAKAKAAARAAKAASYWTGVVTKVSGTTRCRVAYGDKEVPCVVPESLLVSVDDEVQIRVRGNDYTVGAVLAGEKQAAWVAETASDAAEAAAAVNTFAHDLEVTMDAKWDEANALAASASANASAALTAANGKGRNLHATSSDINSYAPFGEFDVWWDYTDASKVVLKRRSGSSWVIESLGPDSIATGAITSAKIATGAVLTAAIADAAVDTAELKDSAVSQVKIANLAVGTAKIADAAVVQAKIGSLAVGTAQIADAAIVSAKIGDAQVVNAKIADATIQNAKIATLDAAKITTGTLSADRIASNSIVASKVLIGAFDNLFANGGCEVGSISPNVSNAPTYFTVAPSTAQVRSGSYSFGVTEILAPSGSQAFLVLNGQPVAPDLHIPCVSGEKFYAECYIKAGSGTQPVIGLNYGFRNAAGALISSGSGTAAAPVTTAWTKYSMTVTAPAGASYLYFYLANSSGGVGATGSVFYVDDFYCRKMLTGDLIVDGAITADKLNANAINGMTITGMTINSSTVNTTGTHGKVTIADGWVHAEPNPYTDRAANFTYDGLEVADYSGDYADHVETLVHPGLITVGDAETLQNSRLDRIGLTVYAAPTTTSTVGAAWSGPDTDGYYRVRRQSSLRRLKVAAEDLIADPQALLQLRPRTWFDREEVETAGLDPATATADQCLAVGLRRYPGFIAEEVEAIDPTFCTYDLAELQGVAYDRLAAGLLIIAREQQAQIDTLTSRLEAIEARLGEVA